MRLSEHRLEVTLVTSSVRRLNQPKANRRRRSAESALRDGIAGPRRRPREARSESTARRARGWGAITAQVRTGVAPHGCRVVLMRNRAPRHTARHQARGGNKTGY